MSTETQKNRNKYFGNKKTSTFNSRNKYGLYIIILLILIIVAFLGKDSIIQVFRHGFGSSYNGVHMKKMLSETNDIIEENTEYLNEFINLYNTYRLTTISDNSDFIDQWSSFVTDSMLHLQKTDHHESFNKYSEAVNNALYTTMEFIEDCKDQKLDYISTSKGIDKIKEQLELVIDELVIAFDKNNIEYTITGEGKILYKYAIK